MSELSEFRKAKDKFFGRDHQSPLTPDQRRKFKGLAYYPEEASLAFAVKINEFSEDAKEVVEMATSTGDSASHVRWGEFGFEVKGAPATLVVYRGLDSEELFLPFMDGTSGNTTYNGGRYLELIELDDAGSWWTSTTPTTPTALTTSTGTVPCHRQRTGRWWPLRLARRSLPGR